MSIVLSALQRQRRDTAANWTAQNPTLLAGEIGIESDTLKWKVGDGTAAWNSLAYIPGLSISAYPLVDADIASDAEIAVSKLASGTARQLLQTNAAGTGVEFASNIAIPGTLAVTGNVTFQGDLTVNGTETIINTQTLAVEDKNIELGKVASPTDATADGGGITLKGDTDKTINWIDATDAWTFSEHVDVATGKEYRINGAQVLTGTALGSGVTGSSLTSVGTLTAGALGAGFTTVATGQGGTGIAGSFADGELLIGKTDGTLAKATLTASTGVTITNGDGSITISATGTGGTVTDVTATSPLASTGGTTPDISIQDGTTAQKGAVQLEDSTTSNSITTAATPASVKAAFDLADAALPKAGGTLTGDVTLDNQSDLRFGEAIANGTNYVAFQAPASIAADVTWTLPDADGSAGESLTTDGAGVLGWSALVIADGSITDAKIASNAAIAGTKISPDFGGQNVVTTGDVQSASINGGPLAGMRNAIINGNFAIAQRGTSFAAAANNDDSYNLDRWYVLSDGNDIVDITQNTATVPTNGKYAIALDVETVNSKFGIAQIIEADNCIGLIGDQVTLSFKAKVSATTKLDNVKAAVVAWSGTADTVTSDIISAWGAEGTNPTLIADATYENTPANLSVTTSYATYSLTANIDTASTKNIIVFIWSDVTDTTAGDFLYVTDVQLEPGPVATPFERRPIGTELALCQRYFCLLDTVLLRNTNTNYFATANVSYPVIMRSAPTSTHTFSVAGGAVADNDSIATTGRTGIARVQCRFTTVAAGGNGLFTDIRLDAEL
jgi:hypothetical protein